MPDYTKLLLIMSQASFWKKVGGEEMGYQAEKDAGEREHKKRKLAPVMCEGCNEEGHTQDECPHRSDDAAEPEESEDESEGEDDDGGD